MAGRKNTREQVDARKAEVEVALASGQWSRQVASSLAARWAVSQRQILRDKAAVMEVEVLGLADPTRLEIGVTTTDPAMLAREVLEGLPMLGNLLGMEPVQLIDAAYSQGEE